MITIGIPVYKRTFYIADLLDRCLKQTYSDYEILISDSSPDDAIQKIVRSFDSGRIRYMRKPADTRITAKLNDLVKNGRGSHMLILCDDDQIETDYLKAMDALIRAYPGATLYRCRYRLIDRQGNLMRLDRLSPKYMSPPDFLRHVLLHEKEFFKMNITGLVFPRELFIKKGGFVELPVPWHTDRLAWSTLAAEGGCAFEERPLCSIRLHEGSITSSFGSDLPSSLESDLRARKLFTSLIDRTAERYKSASDRQMLEEARRNLRVYMQRHLARSLDHGFLASLSERSRVYEKVKALYSRMKDLEVGTFRSARIYYLLGALPQGIRLPMVNAVKHYKVKKWTS